MLRGIPTGTATASMGHNGAGQTSGALMNSQVADFSINPATDSLVAPSAPTHPAAPYLVSHALEIQGALLNERVACLHGGVVAEPASRRLVVVVQGRAAVCCLNVAWLVGQLTEWVVVAACAGGRRGGG